MKKIHISKKYIFSLVVVVALVTGAGLAWWASAPKKGRITSTPSQRNQSEGYSVKELDGRYISLSYSGRYVASSEPPRDGYVELHMLRASTTYNKQIAVSVAELPGGNADSNGQYLHRKKRTDLYQNRKVAVGDRMVDVWVKKDGSEQTAMMPKGELLATLSFTTANQNDNLTAEVDEILKSLRWKQ
jgi:hypothetical protein